MAYKYRPKQAERGMPHLAEKMMRWRAGGRANRARPHPGPLTEREIEGVQHLMRVGKIDDPEVEFEERVVIEESQSA